VKTHMHWRFGKIQFIDNLYMVSSVCTVDIIDIFNWSNTLFTCFSL